MQNESEIVVKRQPGNADLVAAKPTQLTKRSDLCLQSESGDSRAFRRGRGT